MLVRVDSREDPARRWVAARAGIPGVGAGLFAVDASLPCAGRYRARGRIWGAAARAGILGEPLPGSVPDQLSPRASSW
jgi:hypothetical protein